MRMKSIKVLRWSSPIHFLHCTMGVLITCSSSLSIGLMLSLPTLYKKSSILLSVLLTPLVRYRLYYPVVLTHSSCTCKCWSSQRLLGLRTGTRRLFRRRSAWLLGKCGASGRRWRVALSGFSLFLYYRGSYAQVDSCADSVVSYSLGLQG